MTQATYPPLKSKLYETDYYLWIENTIKQLQLQLQNRVIYPKGCH
jgi:hypothetical protein